MILGCFSRRGHWREGMPGTSSAGTPAMTGASCSGRVLLSYDGRVARFGSREHFFHFMWGYLLPSLRICQEQRRFGNGRECYAFLSCGPVMDRVLSGICSHLNIDFEIWPMRAEEPSARLVPRWDVALMRSHLLGADETLSPRMRQLRDELRSHPPLLDEFCDPNFPTRLRHDIEAVREWCLSEAGRAPVRPELASLAGHYLLLRRSAQPKFYEEGGPAEIPVYGTGRRSLTNLEEVNRHLSNRGIPVRIFEPGSCSLVEQMRVFRTSRGIIAIRGAELANLIWMEAGSKVIVVTPPEMAGVPPPHLELCRLLELEPHQLDANGGAHQELDSDEVARLLGAGRAQSSGSDGRERADQGGTCS